MNYDDTPFGRVERAAGREAASVARDFGELRCFATLRMVFGSPADVTSIPALWVCGVYFDVNSVSLAQFYKLSFTVHPYQAPISRDVGHVTDGRAEPMCTAGYCGASRQRHRVKVLPKIQSHGASLEAHLGIKMNIVKPLSKRSWEQNASHPEESSACVDKLE